MSRTKRTPSGIRTAPDHNEHDFRTYHRGSGNIFFVYSGVSASGNGLTPEGAVQTIGEAINLCAANNGDVIFVLEGHAETQDVTGAMFTADVAGVKIQGLGIGDLRPKLTFGHTGADIVVSAADVWMDNFQFVCSVADQTHVFDVTAKRFKLTNFKVRDDGAADNFIDFIDCSSTSDNNADGLAVMNGDVLSDDTGNDGLIEVNADIDDLRLEGNLIRMGVASEAIIGVATGKDVTNALIKDNDIYRLNIDTALLLDPDTTDANSGLIIGNNIGHEDTASEVLIPTGSKFRFIENYGVAADDSSGFLLPTADS